MSLPDLPTTTYDKCLIHFDTGASEFQWPSANPLSRIQSKTICGGQSRGGTLQWETARSPSATTTLAELSRNKTASNLVGDIPRPIRAGSQIIVKSVKGSITLDCAYIDMLASAELQNDGNFGAGNASRGETIIGYGNRTVEGTSSTGTGWTVSIPNGIVPFVRTSVRIVAVKANRQIGSAGVSWDDVFDNSNGVAGFFSFKKEDPDGVYEIMMDRTIELNAMSVPQTTINYDFRNLNMLVKFQPFTGYDEEVADHGIHFIFAWHIGGGDYRNANGLLRLLPVFLSSRCEFINWAQ